MVACNIKVKQYPCFIWNMVVAWMIYGSTLKRILWAVQVCSANSNFVYVRPFSLNKWFNSRSTFSSKLSDPICYKHTNQGQLCQTILHSNLMYDTKGICDFNFQVKSYVYDQNDTMFWNFYWIQFCQRSFTLLWFHIATYKRRKTEEI